MFGGLHLPQKPKLRPRPIPKIVDVPGTKADTSGYVAGREPGSDYKTKMMQYEQRKQGYFDSKIASLWKDIAEDKYSMKFMIHSEKRGLQRDIKARVDKKMEEYDEKIEKRREKLLELFWREEREFMKEAIDQAQKGEQYKSEQMHQRVLELRARREAERQELAKQKTLQKHLNNCDSFRPYLYQKRLNETKEGQLQQIQDNESKRESERELERFWHQMMMKELDAKNEREKQDELALRRMNSHNVETWEIQQQEKAIRVQELEREKKEDFIKLENLREEMLREKIKDLDEKRRNRDKMLKEAQAQILEKERTMKRREEDERSVVRAYEQLVVEEIEKEKQNVKNTAEINKKEMQQFMDYVKRLEQERKEEEKILESLVAEARKEIETKQNEAFCKREMARRKLKDATLQGLADQLKNKREEAEQQLKMKQAENELIRLNCEQNERLRAEHERQKLLAAKGYRDDLKRQIEYMQLQKERERKQLERELEIGLEEEKKFQKIISDMLKGVIKPGYTHPFEHTLNKESCECPAVRK